MIANYKKQHCPEGFHVEARREERRISRRGAEDAGRENFYLHFIFIDAELKQFPDVVAKETNLFQYVDYVYCLCAYVPMW
jgi:hypothetical protein